MKRSPEEILKAYEMASKESPLIITNDEGDNFIKAMKIGQRCEDNRNTKTLKITLMDKDKLLANGVKSPINKKSFTNRREWKEHLKANGCVEVGNDFNNAKEVAGKLRGDYDVRDDLGKATYEVMAKYGH